MRRHLVAATCLVLLSAPVVRADTIDLPTPEAARVQQSQLILAVGGRPDRLKHSIVPGKVTNDELIQVGLAGDGSVQTVYAEQRLDVEGVGDYAIRERGPARQASSLNGERPPLTQRGAVVWQGFTPGHRSLAARLRLDPAIEAQHLPLAVRVTFTSTAGTTSLQPGGLIPGPGTVHVTVSNVTSQPQQLPTGSDAAAAELAAPLDLALRVARQASAARLPTTDDKLVKRLTVSGGAVQDQSQSVPLRLTGTLALIGTTGSVSGPTTTPAGTFAGTLGGSAPGTGNASVTFDVTAAGPGRLALSLHAVGALNARELAPPRALRSWAAWAASHPPLAERKSALDLLVAVAATGARASSYSPYLGADLVGTGSTAYDVSFAPPTAAPRVAPALHPRWLPLSLLALGALALVGIGAVVWRRS